jgi:hypothetical protein
MFFKILWSIGYRKVYFFLGLNLLWLVEPNSAKEWNKYISNAACDQYLLLSTCSYMKSSIGKICFL